MTSVADSERMMTALKFTTDDLAANREGRLSAAQRVRLRRDRRRAVWIGVALVVVVVLVATALLYAGQVNGTPVLTFIGVAVTVCSAVVSGMLVRNWYRLTSDLDGGMVQVLAGTMQHTVRVTGRVAVYVLKIDGHELTVTKSVFLSLRNGGDYRLYRTPAARVLLSAEAA